MIFIFFFKKKRKKMSNAPDLQIYQKPVHSSFFSQKSGCHTIFLDEKTTNYITI